MEMTYAATSAATYRQLTIMINVKGTKIFLEYYLFKNTITKQLIDCRYVQMRLYSTNKAEFAFVYFVFAIFLLLAAVIGSSGTYVKCKTFILRPEFQNS